MPDPLLLLLLGTGVGLIMALTGAGGSIIAVPLLMGVFGWALPQASAVALAAVALAAGVGAIQALRQRLVRYRAAILMSALGLLLVPLGLGLARSLPSDLLSGLFAAVLLIAAARMAHQALRAPQETAVTPAQLRTEPVRAVMCRLDPGTGRLTWTSPCAFALALAGAFTGLLSGLLGVGGGFVVVPALRWLTDVSVSAAVATSLLFMALVSGGATLMNLLQPGVLNPALTAPFAVGALLGMLGGRLVAGRLSGPHLQLGFAILLVGVSGSLLWPLMI